jgi:hypothetical protein
LQRTILELNVAQLERRQRSLVRTGERGQTVVWNCPGVGPRAVDHKLGQPTPLLQSAVYELRLDLFMMRLKRFHERRSVHEGLIGKQLRQAPAGMQSAVD